MILRYKIHIIGVFPSMIITYLGRSQWGEKRRGMAEIIKNNFNGF